MELMKSILSEKGYMYIRDIGSGGYGSVSVVRSLKYNQDFACKVFYLINKEDTRVERLLRSYEREKDLLIRIFHPNIVKLYDTWKTEEMLFLIEELCSNKSIDNEIEETEGIQPARLVLVANQVAHAMEYLHSFGIAHHDLKPSNFFVDSLKNVKLGDFGLATHYKVGERSEMRNGTLPYLAPEIIDGKPFDPFKADVWAFGVSLYWLAYKKLPFPGSSLDEIRNCQRFGYVLPRGCKHRQIKLIIAKCLREDPTRRPTFLEIMETIKITPSMTVGKIRRNDFSAMRNSTNVMIKSFSPLVPMLSTPVLPNKRRMLKP